MIEDFIFEHPVLSILIGLLIFISILFIVFSIAENNCKPLLLEIDNMGYDSTEVRIFCRRIGSDLEDFIASKGLQLQYIKFSNGEETEFIKQAMRVKDKKDADSRASSAMATGLAVGIACR